MSVQKVGALGSLGLRWFTLFLLFYMFFGDEGLASDWAYRGFPGSSVMGWYAETILRAWSSFIPWLGERIAGHPVAVTPVDTLSDYLIVGICLAITLLGAIAWTLLDRDPRKENTLYNVTSVLVRYNLAAIILTFGFMKTFHGQFPAVGPIRLMEPGGDFSPNGLMWVFMGYSPLYEAFSEIGELIGAFLLFFRRTTALGALIIAGIMTNVLMMNISYDVMARIFAAFYLLMAIYLLIPDIQRLMSAILGFNAPPTIPSTRVWPRPWMQWASVVVKVVVIGLLFLSPLVGAIRHGRDEAVAQNLPMNGLYRIQNVHALLHQQRSVEGAWERVAIEGQAADWLANQAYPYLLAVRTTADDMQYYSLRVDRVDPTHGYFYLVQCDGYMCPTRPLQTHTLRSTLRYTIESDAASPKAGRSKPQELTLSGSIGDVPVSMRLARMDTSKYLLVQTSFHLIEPDDEQWNL